MRIAYISPGAAGMYCGTCIHGNTLASALLRMGHEVALMPTYTPIRTDETDVSVDQIFYGGINVYLQQKLPFFRHTPRALDRLLNNRSLLKWIARLGSSTDGRELGALTVSVLKGADGHQNKELAKLIEWLRDSYKPDIVHLSLSLFIGFAEEIKKVLRVPVLCSVQGEDLFFDELVEPYRSETLDLICEKAADVDGFVATSEYYADHMSELLRVSREKFHVVRLGINLQDHVTRHRGRVKGPFTVGYLARICPEKGLHLLVDAFRVLREKLGPGRGKLLVAGYLSKKDHGYLSEIEKRILMWGLGAEFEYWGEVDRARKLDFLNRIDVLSVPTVYREPKGLFVLEALAHGVPVVQPSHGSFPEMIEATGGGILVQPNSAQDLADGIEALLLDEAKRRKLGEEGRKAVHEFLSDEAMAEATLEVYQQHLSLLAARKSEREQTLA